ncbi:MAG: hypothetical protein IT260_03440 [Saprospiraceae bacterium]|nr:hypothetical protein [Saprospiraceae bacterium]
MIKYIGFTILFSFPFLLFSQNKYDYNWTIGYDTSELDPGGDVILIDFNIALVSVQTIKSVDGIASDGANTTMSDSTGKLIF